MACEAQQDPQKMIQSTIISGVSKSQLERFLALMNVKEAEGVNRQAHTTVTKPTLSKVSSDRWIIDSGATDHIVSSSSFFTHSNNNQSRPPVLLPSGEEAQITSTGSVPLNSSYHLHDVLCVPNFKVDLLSISRLTRGLSCSVTFYPDWCVLQDLVSGKTIGLGKHRDGLYYLKALATENTQSHHPQSNQSACHLVMSPTNIWHRRLGHVSSRPLDYIAKHFLNISITSDNVCDVCPLAKQNRLSFGTSSISSVKPFDPIHCDIWGSYKHSSLTGAPLFSHNRG